MTWISLICLLALSNSACGRSAYGDYYHAPRVPQLDQQVAPVPELSPADLLCRGQQPETVIPIENNRAFVVCLGESKGFEQHCPKGLFYDEQSRRCERSMLFEIIYFLSYLYLI